MKKGGGRCRSQMTRSALTVGGSNAVQFYGLVLDSSKRAIQQFDNVCILHVVYLNRISKLL